MINEPVDVLIVGAGASGAAIAYSLSSLGVKILCLEQGKWVYHNYFPSTKQDTMSVPPEIEAR